MELNSWMSWTGSCVLCRASLSCALSCVAGIVSFAAWSPTVHGQLRCCVLHVRVPGVAPHLPHTCCSRFPLEARPPAHQWSVFGGPELNAAEATVQCGERVFWRCGKKGTERSRGGDKCAAKSFLARQ
eukprot:356531-Chlamydomonas_euryale.AAC.4